jgi:hypothetical protein
MLLDLLAWLIEQRIYWADQSRFIPFMPGVVAPDYGSG